MLVCSLNGLPSPTSSRHDGGCVAQLAGVVDDFASNFSRSYPLQTHRYYRLTSVISCSRQPALNKSLLLDYGRRSMSSEFLRPIDDRYYVLAVQTSTPCADIISDNTSAPSAGRTRQSNRRQQAVSDPAGPKRVEILRIDTALDPQLFQCQQPEVSRWPATSSTDPGEHKRAVSS